MRDRKRETEREKKREREREKKRERDRGKTVRENFETVRLRKTKREVGKRGRDQGWKRERGIQCR